MKVEIRVPQKAMPKKDLENPCPCQDRPVNMRRKKGILTWMKNVGEQVFEGEVICEAEVEKKALEFVAPVSGILCEIRIEDEEKFGIDDILGYIETE